MTSEALMESNSDLPVGEVRFVRASESPSLVLRSECDNYVTVAIPEIQSTSRGRLAALLEEAIDRALELRGACAPGREASTSLDSSLSDQLYRARLIGARGLTLVLPTMEGITSSLGALDADDCATLRWWIGAVRERPLRVYLDVADCMLGAYLEPVTLTQMLHLASSSPKATNAVVVEWADSASDLDPKAAEAGRRPSISDVVASAFGANADVTQAPSNEFETSSPPADPHDSAEDLPTETTNEPFSVVPTLVPPSGSSPTTEDFIASFNHVKQVSAFASRLEGGTCESNSTKDAEASPSDPDAAIEDAQAVTTPIVVQAPAHATHDANRTHDVILPAPHPATIAAPAPATGLLETDVEPAQNQPLHADAPNAWRSWMQRLEAARGPKPLNAIEQLFINAYVPLADAYHRGIAGPECAPVLQQWSASFAKSYGEAYDAMRVRGRRPMMVLDIPEAAQRLARLHGARSIQLILVDGMRFDVGMRVERLLLDLLGHQATLTDRFLLWSGLPTTTAQQLELIARGPEGLRDGDMHSDTPVLVARGRSASTLRRIRVGSRELLKLDLVEARLAEPGAPLAARLDRLAEEVSEALASSISRLSARTLVAVFGDHGFCLDTTDVGTEALRHGGASPEEVLVPGCAWLVGQPQ
ncbi:MAG TPA: hypothetical protein VIV60_26705 [Polyangiaceae bacterium]